MNPASTSGLNPWKGLYRACPYEPGFVGSSPEWDELFLCSSLFLSRLISRLSGRKLCKYGIFKMVFVVIKQTAPCIRLQYFLHTVCLLMFTLFFVFFSCLILYARSKSAKLSIPVRWNETFIWKILSHLTEIPPSAR